MMSITFSPADRSPADASSRTRVGDRRRLLVVGSDFAAVGLGVSAARVLTGSLAPPASISVLYGAVLLVLMSVFRLYHARLATDRREERSRIARAAVLSLLAVGLLAAVSNTAIDLRAGLAMLAASVGAVAGEREVLRRWFASRRRVGHGLWASILVASEVDGARIRSSIEADKTAPYVVVDQIDPSSAVDADGLLSTVLALAEERAAQGVLIAEGSLDGESANVLVRGLLDNDLHVDLTSTLSDISIERLAARSFGPSIATRIAPRPRGGWRGRSKRAFDLAIAVSSLVVLAPLFAVVAVVIKATSDGPVFFEQERVGRWGESFGLLKFRSMVVGAEALRHELDGHNEGAGPLFKVRCDPRVTRVGRFLRKTSIDELPQLINVLRNEMSLIGPRPALLSEMAEWEAALHGRLMVKPGITGMWQVSGRSELSFDEYMRLDLYYVHNWSLLVDLAILARTVPAVLRSDGAY